MAEGSGVLYVPTLVTSVGGVVEAHVGAVIRGPYLRTYLPTLKVRSTASRSAAAHPNYLLAAHPGLWDPGDGASICYRQHGGLYPTWRALKGRPLGPTTFWLAQWRRPVWRLTENLNGAAWLLEFRLLGAALPAPPPSAVTLLAAALPEDWAAERASISVHCWKIPRQTQNKRRVRPAPKGPGLSGPISGHSVGPLCEQPCVGMYLVLMHTSAPSLHRARNAPTLAHGIASGSRIARVSDTT